MAAIAFDTLAYARRLKAVGVPEEQAEVQAELMAEQFVFNMDSLVTKDYLDARLKAEFSEFENKLDKRFAAIDVKFAEIDGKFRLIYWMLGISIASTTLPQLVSFFRG
jgi:type II secretory pathway component PulK